MKPKNFPARKLRRQIRAAEGFVSDADPRLVEARKIRTKKFRGR